MGFSSVHIKVFIISSLAILLVQGMCPAYSQELVFPERWNNPLTFAKPLFKPDTLTIRVLGDIMMHENQILTASRPGGQHDFSSYFMFIEDAVRDADITVANMEFTLAGEPYSGYPCFSAPDPFAGYLAECGFDIFLSANNHIFDKGTTGAERTAGIYRKLQESHGIRFTGIAVNAEELNANNPLLIRVKGMNLAMLNLTYGTNAGLQTLWPRTNYIGEKKKLADAFETARDSGADFIMVFPHWGTEYVLQHSEKQEEDARRFVENGADLIMGAHPHVIQDCGMIDGVPVVYSLGNAVSNMSAANTQLELMATIRIVREDDGDMKLLPLEFTYLWCSRPGGFNDSYTVIPVLEFMDRKDEWKNIHDYYKMTATYERVKKETGINE